MLAKLHTYSLLGIEALPVEVEVDISPGALPKTQLVGLPEAAVRESTHRVARAIVNSGFIRPSDRVVINLAPGDLPKQAASFGCRGDAPHFCPEFAHSPAPNFRTCTKMSSIFVDPQFCR